MNKKIEELYNKIDGLNSIIDLQTLEISQLKNKINEAIEYIKSWVLDEYSIAVIDKEDDNCCYFEPDAKEMLLEILGDKENE